MCVILQRQAPKDHEHNVPVFHGGCTMKSAIPETEMTCLQTLSTFHGDYLVDPQSTQSALMLAYASDGLACFGIYKLPGIHHGL